ncbi:MAG: hypothetical protein ACREMU_00825, partial [Gemmatimonadaceae bacterium]
GRQRLVYYRTIRKHLESDLPFCAFFEGQSTTMPQFYVDRVRADLREYWSALPEGGMLHDQNAYLRSTSSLVDLQSAPAIAAAANAVQSRGSF